MSNPKVEMSSPVLELVDTEGRATGQIGKIDAHRGVGALHRAISVLLFDAAGRLLIQRRARTKYHFAGMWANSCCSHPSPGESPVQAARRTAYRELQVVVDLEEAGTFLYDAFDPQSGYVEREFDHVFVGKSSGKVRPCESEVDSAQWVDGRSLARSLVDEPHAFVPWLKPVLATAAASPVTSSMPEACAFFRAFKFF